MEISKNKLMLYLLSFAYFFTFVGIKIIQIRRVVLCTSSFISVLFILAFVYLSKERKQHDKINYNFNEFNILTKIIYSYCFYIIIIILVEMKIIIQANNGGVLYGINKLIPFITFVMLVRYMLMNNESINKIYKFLIYIIIVSSIAAFILYLCGYSQVNIAFGGKVLVPYSDFIKEFNEKRLTWIMTHKSRFAMFNILSTMLLINYKEFKLKFKTPILGLLFINTVLSNDMASIFCLMVIYAYYLLVIIYNKIPKEKRMKVLISFGAIGCIVSIGFIVIISHLRNVWTLGGRTYIWSTALHYIWKHPFGNLVRKGHVYFFSNPHLSFKFSNAHNIFINEGIDSGFIGIIFYGLIYGYVAKIFYKLRRHDLIVCYSVIMLKGIMDIAIYWESTFFFWYGIALLIAYLYNNSDIKPLGRKKNEVLVSKKLWIINVIISKISYIIPKKKNLWVYGCWLGDKYCDNSKYMYEYVYNNHKNIDVVWLSKNKQLVNNLKELGFKAEYSNSLKGILYQLRAGVVLYTNSLYDISDYMFFYGAYKVALWHGMPLKKLYLDNNSHQDKMKSKKKRIIFNLRYMLFNDVKRNLSIVTSEKCREDIATAFGLKKEDIAITGQPRNDVFIKELNRTDVLKVEGINPNAKIVTYMPTYRSNQKNNDKFMNLLSDILQDSELEELLEKQNLHMIIKFHFLGGNLELKNKYITFINDKDITDTQELLNITDILITDYSSCFIDYLLKKSPLMFVANDIAGYEEKENGFYYDYRKITSGLLAENKEQFKVLLEKLSVENSTTSMEDKYSCLNKIFNEIQDNCYSENVFKEIVKRLQIKNM